MNFFILILVINVVTVFIMRSLGFLINDLAEDNDEKLIKEFRKDLAKFKSKWDIF